MNNASNAHYKVFNYQKRLLDRRIKFAVFRHKSSIMIVKRGKTDLLPDVIEILKTSGYKVYFLPPMSICGFGLMPGIWTIEW